MGGMWLWWLVALALLIVLARLLQRHTSRTTDPETPEQILKRRYASGHIGKEEYEHKLKDLRQ